jgi:aminocarboxymuconate-semialdehyde decarboxylase
MIIDSHAHFVPADLLSAIEREQKHFPSVRVIAEGGSLAFAFAGGKPTRSVSKPLSDLNARIAWMNQQGVDLQVVGGWVDMFGYELPASEGENWSRLINDALLATSKTQPRFVPLASVPMQDGARAAAVLKQAMSAGFPGAMIGTLPRGIGSVLDAKDLDPFWAAADDTGAVVHIHPSFDAGDARVHDYGLQNALGRITDAIVAVARLLYSGHIARFRDVKFVVPMGAAGLPFVLGRLKRNREITPGLADPAEAIARLYTDTILHDPAVLRFVLSVIDADHVMLGSDMPFPIGDLAPTKIVAAAGLSEAQAAQINGDVAARVFGIEGRS